jgi:hypothetical protein
MLGFPHLFRYGPGKLHWFANGLRRSGERAGDARAGDIVPADVPTSRPGEHCREVASRVRRAGWNACVVVDQQQVVLGLLEGDFMRGPVTLVEQAIDPAPHTLRPSVPLEEAPSS